MKRTRRGFLGAMAVTVGAQDTGGLSQSINKDEDRMRVLNPLLARRQTQLRHCANAKSMMPLRRCPAPLVSGRWPIYSSSP